MKYSKYYIVTRKLKVFSIFEGTVKSHFTTVGATTKNRDRGLILSIHGWYLAGNKMSCKIIQEITLGLENI